MLTSDLSLAVTPAAENFMKIQCDDFGQRPEPVKVTLAWAPALDGPAHRAWLDTVERERYDRLRVPAARARFVTGRALARTMVGAALSLDPSAVRFVCRCRTCGAAHGRPSAPGSGLDFSISHCGDVVGVAMVHATGGARVGLDIEDAGPERAARAAELPGLADVTLSPAERPEVLGDHELTHAERWRRFARYWCRKEALVKADGIGLELDLTTITVSSPDAAPAVLRWPGAGVPNLVDVTVPSLSRPGEAPWGASVCVLAATALPIELTVVPTPPHLLPALPNTVHSNGAR